MSIRPAGPTRAPGRPRGRALPGAALALALAAAAPAAAQARDDAAGISLAAAVEEALRSHPGVERARLQVEASRGEVISAGSRFEPTVVGAFGGEREALASADPAVEMFLRTHASYSVQVQTRTRAGVYLQPEVAVRRTASPATAEPLSSAAVRLRVDVPLLRDRAGRESTAPERSARVVGRSDLLGLSHAGAVAVLETAVAYWGLAAAEERLRVQAEAEDRAEQLTRETRLLVEGGERAATDLNQVMGTLALRRVNRIAAEQAVGESRQRLALAMGIPTAALPAGGATTGFPPAAPAAPADREVAALAHRARSERADLGQARGRTRAAELLLEGVRDGLKPELGVSLSVGYNSTTMGSGMDQLVVPLYSEIPGLNASLQLQYRLPVSRGAARGQVVQREGLRGQLLAAEREIERRIDSGVELAVHALRRGEASLRETGEAVRLLTAAVEAERRKFHLGSATLLDILQAEDGLTNARLAEVASRQGYAVAVATLRFETGTLVTTDAGLRASVELDHLLVP